jgi:hypothetical protein
MSIGGPIRPLFRLWCSAWEIMYNPPRSLTASRKAHFLTIKTHCLHLYVHNLISPIKITHYSTCVSFHFIIQRSLTTFFLFLCSWIKSPAAYIPVCNSTEANETIDLLFYEISFSSLFKMAVTRKKFFLLKVSNRLPMTTVCKTHKSMMQEPRYQCLINFLITLL